MRTITEKFANRLEAQAKEAELQGLSKVADHLSNIIKDHDTRETGASYTYAEDDFKTDVEKKLWEGVVRATDFFDCDMDAAEMQDVVSKLAKHLIDEVRIKGGVRHGVGAYEPNVPGERLERVTIEVEEPADAELLSFGKDILKACSVAMSEAEKGN
ncbi:hypothetical protein LCGC14_0526250 [marine sediment metagenome]|uniref:Uncharacterized protein n=1 Tax=marine sediment metagenome TaxID=412755 RepID=A0A0F9RX45_9ZZZZ